MACCKWAHVLDFAENGYDRYEQNIKKTFPEGFLRGTLYGNHPRTKYALNIHSIIEELMNKDWCKVNNNIK